MNKKYVVTVVFKGFRSTSQKAYDFAAYEEYKPGDIIIVNTCNGYAVAEVIRVAEILVPTNGFYELQEVVSKVDDAAFKKRQEIAREKLELKAQMDAIVVQMKSTDIYETFAAKNPELKALLDKFKQLNA